MEVIRIKNNEVNSSLYRELLANRIRGKKTIIVVPLSTDIEKDFLLSNEYASYLAFKGFLEALDLTDYLRQIGINVRYLDIHESGINTNKNYLDAIIESIDPYYFLKYLNSYDCLIISGGIGLYHNSLTLLGEEGADLSAVALGVRLDCPIVFFDEGIKKQSANDFYSFVIQNDIPFNMKALLLLKNNNPIIIHKMEVPNV